jgi:transketolase
MALAEKLLGTEFNRPGHAIVDHFTYAFLGDGCLMEGISHEAASFAGTLRVSRLICFYDDNGISIDGHVVGWFRDDTPRRFDAYGWNVIAAVDGHDTEAIDAAIRAAKTQAVRADGKPTLICCRTVIGKGSPNKAGTHDVHGAALGAREVAATRAALGWTNPPFEIPEDVTAAWNTRGRGARAEDEWQRRFAAYHGAFPDLATEFERRMRGDLTKAYDASVLALCDKVAAGGDAVATRKASQNALSVLAPLLPELFGGSADLTGSNLTNFEGCTLAGRDRWGNHLSYGVREFGMAAIMNGIALHGGYIPYGGTFLTFSDYSRNAIRMAALMRLRVIHVFTHDSIGLGEDGPTHQAVEHTPSLRLIPNLDVWRPADSLETLVAWSSSIARNDGPSALILSRQNLPVVAHNPALSIRIARGGYVLSDQPDAVAAIIATGSEVSLALDAQNALAGEGIPVRVVSMPSTSIFDRQPQAYQDGVLPQSLPTVAVEAAHPDFWRKYVGRNGAVVGISTFGESAPAKDLYVHFGITSARVIEACRAVIARGPDGAVRTAAANAKSMR